MATIIVLFNLKPGADVTAYEHWATTTDLPTVNALNSVKQFTVLKSSGLLSGAAAPYQYVEILEVQSVEALRADVASETMKRVGKEFREFAESPLFIVTEPIG